MSLRTSIQRQRMTNYGGGETLKALIFNSSSSNTLSLTNTGGNAPYIEYSYDGKTWQVWDYSALAFTSAQPLYLRGENDKISESNAKHSEFKLSGVGDVSCEGDLAYLISTSEDEVEFKEGCFVRLFYSQTLLVKAPNVSAIHYGGYSMSQTFAGCSRLTQVPLLTEGSLSNYAFYLSFNGCTSLNYVKCLFASHLPIYTSNWLSNVAVEGTFVKKAGVAFSSGINGIPTGWTIVEI